MTPEAAGLAGLLLLVVGAGCASVRDDAVVIINASADFGAGAEKTLEAMDKREQEDALTHSWDKAHAQAAIEATRHRYAAAWKAYREYRLAVIAAQSSVNSYDAAERLGQAHDAANLLVFVRSLEDAEKAFVDATAALREGR